MASNKLLIGAHAIIYSKDAEADRLFLRDVLGLSGIDVGDGWLVFGLPPSELAVHPADKNDVHELYFMCRDIDAFVAAMQAKGVRCSAIQTLNWGRRAQLKLPGGGKLGVYQPLHARPKAAPKTRK
ncbi:MAG TPA: hypothetical protein VMJ64_17845 [Anaerolineales bacterium]|nr:hypothetical protein [Anaerolineales bacterium]